MQSPIDEITIEDLMKNYTPEEMIAIQQLMVLRYRSHEFSRIVERAYDNAAENVLNGAEIWANRQEAHKLESERLMEGTRLEKYVYKPQMARNLATHGDSLVFRTKNNEASRQSRFNKAREIFIKENTNKLNWEYLDEMQEELRIMDENKRAYEERLARTGCSTIRFAMLWFRMNWIRAGYLKKVEAESETKSRNSRKRKRSEG